MSAPKTPTSSPATTAPPDFAPPVAQLLAAAIGVSAGPAAGYAVALDPAGRLPVSVPVSSLRVLTADPLSPVVGEFWYRSDTSQLCVRHDASTTKRVTLA